jgi:hypothetical protein
MLASVWRIMIKENALFWKAEVHLPSKWSHMVGLSWDMV